jgi:hypothetical protein
MEFSMNKKDLKDLTTKDDLKKEEEKTKTVENAALTGAAAEVVQRYGSADKEFLVGYSGVDNETGQVLSKSLKVSKKNSINRQVGFPAEAGFSAEVESNSRKNAENIINKRNVRNTRTDDIKKQGYGENTIGGKNDQLYDHVELDVNGKPIQGCRYKILVFTKYDISAMLTYIRGCQYEQGFRKPYKY